ncbi:MAG: hypothetical protein WC375_01550 [Methanomassiliicoccales archaeon]
MSDARADAGARGHDQGPAALLRYGTFLPFSGSIAYIRSDMDLANLTAWFAGFFGGMQMEE